MLTEKNIEELLEEIQPSYKIKNDRISKTNRGGGGFFCTTDAAILYVTEIEYYRELSCLMGGSRNLNQEPGPIILEVLSNAVERGNGGVLGLPIWVEIYEGNKGYVLRVKDSGKGFDFKEVIRTMKEGKRYFKNEGNGFRLYDQSAHEVFFEGQGNIVNILIRNNEGITITP
ncbi:ATP-binding protein [Candidatus Woesearchaeota archaeon]|nr:ATP-binding protein [Candidatus Woesearchaeota archaeon]